MQLTSEQQAIIQSTGNIKINAVAGSGKTTTVIEYAKTRTPGSRILYLAFNKSVKLEAVRKFKEKNIHYVKVETAHSLAYKYIVFPMGYKVKNTGYKTHELVDLLRLEGNGEKHHEYIIANHINKFMMYYCNSDKEMFTELNYLDTVMDPKARVFVKSFYDYILKQTELFWDKMESGGIEITHDFYLKKFQLSNPDLPYDYILFDEAQDASPAMLDVFLKQKSTKVIVGDAHQQIYAWRFAVNSLEKAEFQTFHLSNSFRFDQDIADLAMQILKFKRHLGLDDTLQIYGKGNGNETRSRAVLARTNLGLLLKAIEYVIEKEEVEKIYFEGNFNSYTYADDGASLYDVLHLFNNKRNSIQDKLIRTMRDLDELEDYVEKTEDLQLGMMLNIVREYENSISDILRTIKEKQVNGDEKEKAEMIFSTVHRCKGMEYDEIELANDFLTEEKLEEFVANSFEIQLQVNRLKEEINLLYVAVTRTRNRLSIPEVLLPKEFPESTRIDVLRTSASKPHEFEFSDMLLDEDVKNIHQTKKPDLIEEIIVSHADTYTPWSKQSDREMKRGCSLSLKIKQLVNYFGRTKRSIFSRIKKLKRK